MYGLSTKILTLLTEIGLYIVGNLHTIAHCKPRIVNNTIFKSKSHYLLGQPSSSWPFRQSWFPSHNWFNSTQSLPHCISSAPPGDEQQNLLIIIKVIIKKKIQTHKKKASHNRTAPATHTNVPSCPGTCGLLASDIRHWIDCNFQGLVLVSSCGHALHSDWHVWSKFIFFE